MTKYAQQKADGSIVEITKDQFDSFVAGGRGVRNTPVKDIGRVSLIMNQAETDKLNRSRQAALDKEEEKRKRHIWVYYKDDAILQERKELMELESEPTDDDLTRLETKLGASRIERVTQWPI